MSASGIKAGKAFVEIEALDKTAVVLRGVEARLKSLSAWASKMGDALLKTGIAMVAPAAIAMPAYVRFDDAMRRVQARSQATGADFAALTEQAKELGRTTSFTAAQVAALQEILAQKGFKPDAIMAMTPGVMDFARSAGTGDEGDTVLAADLVARVLNNFRLQATDSTRVADVLTRAINSSALSMQTLADTFKYIGPLAADTGMNLEQVVAFIGQLGNAGVEGSMAGTGLRQFLLGLSDTAKLEAFNAVLSRFDRATIKVADDAGNLRPIPEIIADIGQAVDGIGNATVLKSLSDLFGDRALPTAVALARARKEYDGFYQSLLSAKGTAAETARTMDQGAGGAWRRLQSAFEGLQIAIGEALAGPLSELMDDVGKWLLMSVEWVGRNHELVASLIEAGAALVAIGGGLKIVSFAAGGLASLTQFFAFVVANPVGVALAGIATALALAATSAVRMAQINKGTAAVWSERIEFTKRANAADQELMARLSELAEQQALNNDQQREAQSIIDRLTEKYGDLGLSIDGATGKLNGMEEAQRRVAKAQREFLAQDIQNAIADLHRQEDEASRVASGDHEGWGDFFNDWLNPFSDPREQGLSDLDWIGRELMARRKQLAAVLGGGEADGASATPAVPASPGAAAPPAGDKMSKAIEKSLKDAAVDFTETFAKPFGKSDDWFEEIAREREAARANTQAKIDEIVEAREKGERGRPGYVDAVESHTVEAAKAVIQNEANARGMDEMAKRQTEATKLLEQIANNTADPVVLAEAAKK